MTRALSSRIHVGFAKNIIRKEHFLFPGMSTTQDNDSSLVRRDHYFQLGFQ